MPQVSVVIPLRNNAATVERAVRSVLSQTVADLELIVVDNGSTDGGADIVRRIDDRRLRLVEQDGVGVSLARNRGVAESVCEWVAFLDADDEWLPAFLDTVIRLRHSHPSCLLCATAYRRCDSNGVLHDITLRNIHGDSDFVMDNYFEVASSSEPPFCSISVMVRKEALLAIGGFPTDIHQGEDLLTWARLATVGEIAYCRTPLSIFHTAEAHALGLPRRTPPDVDAVGRELRKLRDEHPDIKHLDDYIARWHKMRASIFMRLPGKARQCRQEARLSWHWRRNPRLIVFALLTLTPYKLRMNILHHLSKNS